MLFERGAFTVQDTQAVAGVLRYGLAQAPFYFAALVLVSLLTSQSKYKFITLIAAITLVVKFLSMFLFVPLMGVEGITLATSVMYGATILLFFVMGKNQ